MCSGKMFHSLGATQLNALTSQELILKFGTQTISLQKRISKSAMVYTNEDYLKDIEVYCV